MKKKVLIVVSDYYKDISDALLKSTKKYLNKKSIDNKEDMNVVNIPRISGKKLNDEILKYFSNKGLTKNSSGDIFRS